MQQGGSSSVVSVVMKVLKDVWRQSGRYGLNRLYCLAVLTVIHFGFDLYLGKQAHLMMSFLMWASVYLLLRDSHASVMPSQSGRFSTFVGYILLTVVLVVSIVRLGDKVVGFFPFFAFLSWFLIFIGLGNYQKYLKEFSILLVFGLPQLMPDTAFGLSGLTAQISAYLLWRMGYAVSVDGLFILIPNGGVEVVPACSGVNLITHMLMVAVIFLNVLPARRAHFFFLPLIAILLSILMNSIRVALLASLSPVEFHRAFQYWHSTSGASLFVLFTLVLYGLIYGCFFRPQIRAQKS
jgi:cyanoexosortase A